jgi:hypothetical protein
VEGESGHGYRGNGGYLYVLSLYGGVTYVRV